MKLCTVFRTLLLGCVAISCNAVLAADTPLTADLIIYNAKVITGNSEFTVAQTVAIRGDQIIGVGKDGDLDAFKGPNTQLIDAQQRTVMPGLYDSRVHSYKAAVSELNGVQPTLDSIVSAQEYIHRQSTNKPGAWIVLEGIYPSRLKEGRLPTKDELDTATTNNPVCWIFDKLAVVNSKALDVSKITSDTPSPDDGEVVKEPRHFKPTGLLRNALSVVKLPPAARPPTIKQQRDALKHLYELYNQQGITSIGEKDVDTKAIDLFRDLSHSNELTVRINCARHFEVGVNYDDNVAFLDGLTNAPKGKLPYGPTGAGDDWVRIGALETVLDGDLLMATAYMRTPWGIGHTFEINEPSYRGEIKAEPFALQEAYLEASKRGWQLSTRAVGDAALDFVLNCYQQVQFKTNIIDRRPSVSLSAFQAEQDWARCQKLGISAEMQPIWLYRDGANLTKTLGEKRLKYFLAFKSWFDNGLVAGGGSDHRAGLDSLSSLNPWNPWLGVWATLTRETEQGTTINPEERLTREQAVKLYTYNNAWLNFEEKKKGSIEAGKFADLIVIDTDILKCPVDDILNTKVLLTMVGGKIVWGANLLVIANPQLTTTATSTNLSVVASTNVVATNITILSVTNITTTSVAAVTTPVPDRTNAPGTTVPAVTDSTNATTTVVATTTSDSTNAPTANDATNTLSGNVTVATDSTSGADVTNVVAAATGTNTVDAGTTTTNVALQPLAEQTPVSNTPVAVVAAVTTNTMPVATTVNPAPSVVTAAVTAPAVKPVTNVVNQSGDPLDWSRPAIPAKPSQAAQIGK